jgi:hypothetical protein
MKKSNTKISYDRDADVLSWEKTGRKKIEYASEVGDMIVHFATDNTPVLVEFLEASKTIKSSYSKIVGRKGVAVHA